MSRDIDRSRNVGYPVYGVTMISARNRLVQLDSGSPLQVRDATVNQDDYVIADRCEVVFVPAERIVEALELGERIDRRQALMVRDVRSSKPIAEVMHDKKFDSIRQETTAPVSVGSRQPSNRNQARDEDRELPALFAHSDTPAVSDALDKLGISGQALNIMPLANYESVTVGPAFTVRYVPASNPPGSVGDFIDDVAIGDVVVIDNCGRTDCTVWGDIVVADANGVVIVPRDGA
ncbi:RraA-like protein [Penicillium capsulatum]|uniref:RraA-like protein n=1 Tax=Penicillium capsulatum TaxID=69766 RepID=A0A9W9IC89_9EURO|nr:RraA-like protein [Penicillium capsulatum]KAJ6136091.1 RraA-like protein [Penicillium capsulatum]